MSKSNEILLKQEGFKYDMPLDSKTGYYHI